MIVRCNDAGTKFQITAQSHRDTLDLADVLHRLGYGIYEFNFVFPGIGKGEENDRPQIELTKKEGDLETETIQLREENRRLQGVRNILCDKLGRYTGSPAPQEQRLAEAAEASPVGEDEEEAETAKR